MVDDLFISLERIPEMNANEASVFNRIIPFMQYFKYVHNVIK